MEASSEGSKEQVRIGELSRRVGVSAELLRAWERRYALLAPSRTAGGHRLYGRQDERRVIRMLERLDAGLSAAEAARSTRADLELAAPPAAAAPPPLEPAPSAFAEPADALRRALDRLDERGANAALDRLLAGFALETVASRAVLPYLHDLGERWQRFGDSAIAQEHFASALLRGRLLGLARGWGSGYGPLALLACAPGDQHDLGLVCFGLALHAYGWRIVFLGPDTPLVTTTQTAGLLRPALVVLSATIRPETDALGVGLAALALHAPLAIAGAAVDERDATAAGARLLRGDPFTAASGLAAETWASPSHDQRVGPSSSRRSDRRGRRAAGA